MNFNVSNWVDPDSNWFKYLTLGGNTITAS